MRIRAVPAEQNRERNFARIAVGMRRSLGESARAATQAAEASRVSNGMMLMSLLEDPSQHPLGLVPAARRGTNLVEC